MVWSEERIETLKRLWIEGLSMALIAGEMGGGISRNAVIGKLHRLGCNSRGHPIVAPRRRGRASHKRTGQREPESLRLQIATLRERTCRWPHGDPKQPDFHFCGRQTPVKASYCGYHSGVAYAGCP